MADPDLQIRGGGGHPDPDISGGGTVLNWFFSRPFGSQFALKIGGLQGLSPGSAAEYGISVAEAQTSLLAKRSWRRGARPERWLFLRANVGVGSSNRELERLFHCPKKWRSFSVGKHSKKFTNARNRCPVFFYSRHPKMEKFLYSRR